MYDYSKVCPRCGISYTGFHKCLSDYDMGYEDGHASAMGIRMKTCYKCGQTYTGSHYCPEPEPYLNEYDRGFKAGKDSARREMGCPGVGGLEVGGE